MKTINLRDNIYSFEKTAIEEDSIEGVRLELEYATRLLKEIQDVLIGLTDDDWGQLDLDVEFIS